MSSGQQHNDLSAFSPPLAKNGYSAGYSGRNTLLPHLLGLEQLLQAGAELPQQGLQFLLLPFGEDG